MHTKYLEANNRVDKGDLQVLYLTSWSLDRLLDSGNEAKFYNAGNSVAFVL